MMKSKRIPFRISSLIIGLFVFGLFVFSNYKAAKMGMTHDESSTFLNYATTDVWSCFSDPFCWGTANNHMLNTFLFQQTIHWFGLSEWSLRLPNVVIHLLYLLSSWYLVALLTSSGLLRVTGFVLLNFNPYLLDFFTVARGYGLAMGFIMASITCLFMYARNRRVIWIWSMFSLAFLSVMSVFTSLIYWMTAWGVFLVIQGYFLWQSKLSWKQIIQCQLIPLAFTFILVVLLFRPIQWLEQGGEFLWGAPSLYFTYYFLVADSLYDLRYIGNQFNNKLIFQIITGLFLLTGILITFLQLRKKPKSEQTTNFLIATLLLLFPILIVLLQKWVLGSLFLVNRKALIFIPLAGILTFLTIQYTTVKKKTTGTMLSFLIILFSLLHFGRSFSIDACHEWLYDKHTKRVALFFSQKTAEKGELKIGTDWLFHPSLEFYRTKMVAHPWDKATYSKELLRDSTLDYYYIFTSGYKDLELYFYPVDTLEGNILLLKNRNKSEKN